MGTTYKIKQGDTLSSIAAQYGTTVSALQQANNISNPNKIIAGNTLTLPIANISASNGNLLMATATGNEGYTRGEFKPSNEYNTAYGNATSAKQALDGLGEAKWYYGTDEEGNKILGDDVLNGYLNDYKNRDPFSYDFNADALYQQYKDKYIQQGKMAMADTIGQAAAMTGGYGNSYAQTVGQQQYQASLDKLNDVIPELYQLAYDKHNQEGQDMLDMISLLRGERSNYYDRYNEDYTRNYNDMTYWTDVANTLYNRDYAKYSDDEAYNYQTHRDSIEDNRAERELSMKEEAWELEKQAYNDVSDSGKDNTVKTPTKENDEPKVQAKKTTSTTDFIANHQTVNEWSRRGKSTSSYKEYIEGEINKIEDSLSDEELMYLIQYYGLS